MKAQTIMTGISVTLLASVTPSLAGYTVQTHVATSSAEIHYTWVVHNRDENWGLDEFAIEVPDLTRVLASTAPRPYSNPDGSAYWVMVETREAQVDPHDGRAWLPAAKPGKKWIIWEGLQSPSVYPPGSTATFSLTTDLSVKPGGVASTAATYTPQTNPHYYLSFQGEVIGPSAVSDSITSSKRSKPSVRATDSEFQIVHSTEIDATGDSRKTPGQPNFSVDLYPGLTINGVVGQTYGIQYTTDLGNSLTWRGATNITLIAPTEIWVDPQRASEPHRYYRVVQGPVSIP